MNNAPLLKNKKVFLKQSLFINNIPLLDVFKGSSDPFKEVHSENEENKKKDIVERSLHSEGDEPNQPLLRAAEKLKRKKEKLFRSREEDLKKEYKHLSSSSSSSKDKDIKPHKKFIINMRKKDSDDEDTKKFGPKHPSRKTIRAGEHPKFKCNGKHTHAKNPNINVQTSALKKTTPNGSKREGYKPINASKVELKSPKQSDSDKYPQLTQSHIKYSKQEDAKRLSSEKKEEGKVPRASKVERPKLEYRFDIGKHMRDINVDPLSVSGLSNIGKAAEMREESRIGNLTLKMKQLSKVQMSSKSKKDGISIVPSLSKVVKNSERKKADRSDNKASKKQSTFNPSSSSSDSDESETPKGNAKDPKIYTNKPTDNLQKSAFKTYKEDEGNETPSNSQASLRFNLLKSPKNKHAAPNASASKQNPTGFPSSQTEPQQIGFKTTEGSKEPSKSLKSDEETPKGDTPNGEMPKGETPKSDAKNDKSDGSSSSDEEKQSKRSKSSLSHKSQTPKSDKGSSSNEDKESSSSKKSSKKSVKTYSHDSRSEKHSDDEVSKSENESEQGEQSSEDAVSSHSKRSSKKSVKNDDIFDKSLAESIPSDKEKQKNPDEESSESDDPSETPGK